MTKIKICGMTRFEDVLFCAEAGADFLGMIFIPSTPRYIEPERAAEIVRGLREREKRPELVGVFRDASADYVMQIAELVGLDLVQLHGSEREDDVAAISLPVIKTFRVSDTLPDTTAVPSARWLLFDTFDDRRSGGTGRRFDWSLLAMYERTRPFFLAGGLAPDNVAAAISMVRPDAIDVSSGVEVEDQAGVKDHEKVRSLFERVRRG
jgi:phosphoribosylanthranilate isomerase